MAKQLAHSSHVRKITDGQTELVAEFLAQGEPATTADKNGVPLIRWCAYYGDVDAIRHLLTHGEKLESLGENLDLNGAVFHGHLHLSEFLIENGANVNHSQADTGETILHAALCKTDSDLYDPIVELLLANGADPKVSTKPNVETGSFMRDCRTKQETPLHRAAAFGSEKCIDMLLDAGASKEAKDMHGDSPLSWASWYLRPRSILRKLCYGSYTIHPG